MPASIGMCCMCSSPPTICTSSKPAMMACAAWLIACKLEPHRRFTVVPPVCGDSPAIRPTTAGGVQPLLAGLLGVAHHDVFDLVGIDAGPFDDCLHDLHGQVVGTDLAKDAFILVGTANGRSHAINNHGAFHRTSSSRFAKVVFKLVRPIIRGESKSGAVSSRASRCLECRVRSRRTIFVFVFVLRGYLLRDSSGAHGRTLRQLGVSPSSIRVKLPVRLGHLQQHRRRLARGPKWASGLSNSTIFAAPSVSAQNSSPPLNGGKPTPKIRPRSTSRTSRTTLASRIRVASSTIGKNSRWVICS